MNFALFLAVEIFDCSCRSVQRKWTERGKDTTKYLRLLQINTPMKIYFSSLMVNTPILLISNSNANFCIWYNYFHLNYSLPI